MQKKTEAQTEQSAFDTQFALQMWDLVKFGREFPEQLAKRKFSPRQTEELAQTLEQHQRNHDALVSARGTRAQQTAEVGSLIDDLMGYRVELSGALRILEKVHHIAAPPVRKFDSLGESPRRWLTWMTEARSGVALLEAPLEASMDSPLVRFDGLRERLTAAVTLQQTSAAGLKTLEQTLRSSRAAVLGLAALLRFSGRVAFRGQPDLLARLRVRAGQRRKAAAATEEPKAA